MAEIIEGFRLSPQQRRLWAARPEGAVPVSWIEVSLAGDLAEEELRAAIGRMVERHEALRTTFPVLSGMSVPLQVVGPASFSWETSPAGPMLDTPFDLANGPLLRARLTTAGPREHRLLLALPALCCDALSLFHLVAEIAREPAGEPAMQYIDFSEWQNDLLDSDEGGDLWRRQDIAGLSGWRLPFEAGDEESGRAEEVSIELDSATASRAEALARDAGAPLVVVLLAAWQVLLGRLSGESRLTVGAAFDGRVYEELAGALGLFARYLPLPCDLAAAPSFRALLEQTAAAWAEAGKWQESFSWERLGEAAGGSPDGMGLRAAFRFEDFREETAALAAGEPAVAVRGWSAPLEPVPLALAGRRSQEGLTLRVRSAAGLLPAAETARLAARYRTLLAGALTLPGAALGELELLDGAERRELVDAFNATGQPRDSRLVHRRFAEQAARTPDAPAVICGARTLTFAELAGTAGRIAAWLRRQGIGPDRIVALALDRSPELVAAIFGVLQAGGAYLPLDAGQPRERLARILSAAAPAALITGRFSGPLPEGLAIPHLDLAAGVPLDGDSAGEPEIAPGHLAYVLFTSGSTGAPKGAMISQGGLANYLGWAAETYPVAAGRGAPVHSPIGFDLTVTSLFLPLLSGRPVVLLPEEQGLGGLAEELVTGGFGLAKLTPAHLEALSELLAPGSMAKSAACLVVGGEALTAARLRPWRAAAPDLRLFNEYGPTETVVGCAVYEVPAGALSGEAGPVPIGRPIAATRLYVAGPFEHGLAALPAGVPGELLIGGAGLARGYLGQPGLTAERFVPDPFGAGGERLYRSGDRVRHRLDGELEYLGRIDHQLKIRGFRVEPGEIEAALESHPAVRQCAVAAREESPAVGSSPGGRRLVAYLVAEEGQEPRAGDLRRFLAEKLPAYMVPAAFVVLPALPLTANGKVDRAALPAPGRGRPELEEIFVRPQGLEEEVLAEIWATVLGVERVGANDSFFALGGDSIRSIQVRSEAEKRGFSFTVQQIFQFPTVRTLARALRGESGGPEPGEMEPNRELDSLEPFALVPDEDRSRVPLDAEDAYPVTQLQAGMLFHSELNPESAIYHDIYSFHLHGPLDLPALRAALQWLTARHAALRTSFDLGGSQPLQRIHREVTVPLGFDDLSDLPEAEQEARAAAWQEDEKRHGFEWSRPPLLRAQVHRRGERSFQFSFGFHHAILDGWSVATLLSELFRRYLFLTGSETGGAGEPLPEVSYRRFVAAELRALRSPETRRYWSEVVTDAPRTLLPRVPGVLDDYGRRDIQHHGVFFTEALSEALQQAARQAGVPLKSVLLAAHFRVLAVLTGQTDVTTGMVTNGRIESEGGERALGLFLNTLPLRLNAAGGSWLDLVRAAFEVERAALPHRRFPLAELQRLAGGEGIFETVFNFIHFHVYESVSGLRGLEVVGGSSFEEANFPFAANFSLGGPAGLLDLRFDYDAYQFSAEQIELFARLYERALNALAADPGAPSEHPSLLSQEEQRQLLAMGEGDGTLAPPEWTVQGRLAALARTTPEALAVVFEESTGGAVREVLYGEIDAAASRLARYLAKAGVHRGTLAGICLHRSPELLTAIFAVLKAGGAYLPLDPSYPRERLAQILADAGAGLIVTDEAAASSLPETSAPVVLLDRDRAAIDAESGEPFEVPVSADDAVYVVYTSGSTGVPKGVVATHGGLANFAQAVTAAVGLAPGQRMLQFASIAFDASALQIFPTLTAGATLILHPDPGGLSSQEILQLCLRLGVTVLDLPGALWRQWVETMALAAVPLPESIQVYMTGGERLPGETLRMWARQMDFDGRFLSSYGPTEATVTTTFFLTSADRVNSEPASEPPLGLPLPHTRLRLLDRSFAPVPECVPGELFLGGAGLARGYLKRPDLTAERFLPDPFGAPGSRLYRTGDLARPLPLAAGGGFEFLGRTDHQVKIRGFRVEPGEIETVLARHPAVREAVVVAREDRPGQKRLVAYLLTEPGVTPEVSDLREHVGRSLPDYMVPSAFLALDELPLLPSGKVDRRALLASDAMRLTPAFDFVEPRNAVEEVLAGIWARVLGCEKVGVFDNFFELGGHSLLATQVITRIRQTFEVEIQLRSIFESPSVAGLAALMLADPEGGEKVQRTAELTVQLAGLSDEDVEQMLLAESAAEESNLT